MRTTAAIAFAIGILVWLIACTSSGAAACDGSPTVSCVGSCHGTEHAIEAVCVGEQWACPTSTVDIASCECKSSFPLRCCDPATGKELPAPRCVDKSFTCSAGTATSYSCSTIVDAGRDGDAS